MHEEVSLGAKRKKHENVFCLWTKDDGTERQQDKKVKQYTMTGARKPVNGGKQNILEQLTSLPCVQINFRGRGDHTL